MIERKVKRLDLKRDSAIKEDLAYWLSKRPRKRIAAAVAYSIAPYAITL